MNIKDVSGTHQVHHAISEMPKGSIGSLPDELTLNILQQGNFSPTEIVRLRRVNCQFHRVCASNTLWKDLVVPRPTPLAQSDKEPPLFEDILRMPAPERHTLAIIWEKFTSNDDARPSYAFMRQHPNNRQIAYALSQKGDTALRCAAIHLHRDKAFAITAVKRNGIALAYFAPELRADKEVVLAAVTQNGLALTEAALALKDDKEVVLTAIKQHRSAYFYASDALRCDPDIISAKQEAK